MGRVAEKRLVLAAPELSRAIVAARLILPNYTRELKNDVGRRWARPMRVQ